MTSRLIIGIAALLTIIFVTLVPVVSIWALNTLFVGVLFKSEIPMNIWTCIAMLWCIGLFGGIVKSFTRK